MKGFSKKNLLGCLIALCSCASNPVGLKEYYEWYTKVENGFVKSREMQGVIYSVYYRPSDLMVAYELDQDKTYSKKQIDSLRKEFEQAHFFVLELFAKGNEQLEWNELKEQSYEERITNLSFHMKDKLSIVTDQDTLAPSFYHYERGFELGSRQRFLFAFPKTHETDRFQVIYHDDLFNSSIYKFSFSNIHDYPRLEDAII